MIRSRVRSNACAMSENYSDWRSKGLELLLCHEYLTVLITSMSTLFFYFIMCACIKLLNLKFSKFLIGLDSLEFDKTFVRSAFLIPAAMAGGSAEFVCLAGVPSEFFSVASFLNREAGYYAIVAGLTYQGSHRLPTADDMLQIGRRISVGSVQVAPRVSIHRAQRAFSSPGSFENALGSVSRIFIPGAHSTPNNSRGSQRAVSGVAPRIPIHRAQRAFSSSGLFGSVEPVSGAFIPGAHSTPNNSRRFERAVGGVGPRVPIYTVQRAFNSPRSFGSVEPVSGVPGAHSTPNNSRRFQRTEVVDGVVFYSPSPLKGVEIVGGAIPHILNPCQVAEIMGGAQRVFSSSRSYEEVGCACGNLRRSEKAKVVGKPPIRRVQRPGLIINVDFPTLTEEDGVAIYGESYGESDLGAQKPCSCCTLL